jgi:hypothetical protein
MGQADELVGEQLIELQTADVGRVEGGQHLESDRSSAQHRSSKPGPHVTTIVAALRHRGAMIHNATPG